MPKRTKVERILIRFANALVNDRTYGGHVQKVGDILQAAIEKEIGRTPEDRKENAA